MLSRLFSHFTGSSNAATSLEAPLPAIPPQGPSPSTTQPSTCTAPSSNGPFQKSHLIVLVNGLFGSRHNWQVISQVLESQLDSQSTLIHISTSNQFTNTFNGIDVCGTRLAEEIRKVVQNNPSLERISIVGHSMGGLISRYALGELYSSEDLSIAGLKPTHYVSLATPHLGCEADHGPAQVPLVSWLVKYELPFGLHKLPAVISEPFAAGAFRQTGQQFFHLDRDDGHKPSLLYRLSQDDHNEGKLFWSALAAFETRTCYANRNQFFSGDHLVGWTNASIRRIEELPEIKVEKGTGVVREDPLEFAWSPEIRPLMAAQVAAKSEHLDAGKGHIAEREDIMGAKNAEDLVHREIERDTSSGRSSRAGEQGSTARFGGGIEKKKGSEGKKAVELTADANSREYIDAALDSLQKMSWRRVDVCFGGALIPLFAHQHLQVQRHWLNKEGLATVKHLAMQLAAMEELRKQAAAGASVENK